MSSRRPQLSTRSRFTTRLRQPVLAAITLMILPAGWSHAQGPRLEDLRPDRPLSLNKPISGPGSRSILDPPPPAVPSSEPELAPTPAPIIDGTPQANPRPRPGTGQLPGPLPGPRTRSQADAAIPQPGIPMTAQSADRFQPSDAQRRLQELRQSVNSLKSARGQRVRNIDDKVSRLRRLMAMSVEQCRDLDAAAMTKNPPPPATTPAPNGIPSAPLPIPNPDTLPPPPANVAGESMPPKESIESLMGNAIAISDKAVDQMGLANNLFATGEISLALRIYENVNLNELNASDQTWARYQMAGCHRRLNNEKQAESLYRIVAAAGKSSPYCAQKARWWLDTMRKTARLKQRHLGVVNTLVQLKEASNELVARSTE